MKKYKIVLLSSLLFNVVFLCVTCVFVYEKGGIHFIASKVNKTIPAYNENVFYTERKSLFDTLKINQNSIVFLGDSITQRCEWRELFQNPNIINRGIGSDTTEGVLHRLDDIVASKPKQIFIMIGINDLSYGKKVSEIESNYSNILDTIKEQSPDTEVFVQSVLPVNNGLYGDKINNRDVVHLNKELVTLADKYSYKYIDMYTKVSSQNQLKQEMTVDGIHLKGEGYQVWKHAIEQYVN